MRKSGPKSIVRLIIDSNEKRLIKDQLKEWAVPFIKDSRTPGRTEKRFLTDYLLARYQNKYGDHGAENGRGSVSKMLTVFLEEGEWIEIVQPGILDDDK